MNPKIETALNSQINLELHAFYTYLSMAAYFESRGLAGFAAWMRHHADEEMMHAMKIYDYIHTRRGTVTLHAIGQPSPTWKSALDAFEDAFKHERKVSIAIDELVNLAREERDHATNSFLQWFVDEQVEEEQVVDEVIQKLKLIGDFTGGLYLLDRELAQTSATPEADEGE